MYNGVELHRIRALKDISGVVAAGELGGWLENEENLAHDRVCWVYDDAKVFGNAKVFGCANVHGNAVVHGDATVYGHADVYGGAEVYDDAKVCGYAIVCGRAKVYGFTVVYGNAEVYDCAEVYGYAKVYGTVQLCSRAKVYENACATGDAQIYGHAEVCGDAVVNGYAVLSDGVLKYSSDYITVGPIGSRDRFTTLNLTTGTVQTGCFKGTLDEFEERVREKHGDNRHAVSYNKLIAYFRTLVDTQSPVQKSTTGEISS